MNYLKIYNNLISRAKKRDISGYYEKHHIVPTCLGGTNDKNNIVKLTGREHYIAHQLLVKIYPSNCSIIHAAVMMTVSDKRQNRSKNRLYEWLRIKHSNAAKKRTGKKNGSFGKHWYHNPNDLKTNLFSPGSEPKGWKLGRVPNNKCEVCDQDTGTKSRRFCDQHRPKSKTPSERGYKPTIKSRKKLSEYCKSRTREQHPQFGKRWVNDGHVNLMIPKEQLEEYQQTGWNRGKISRSS